MIRQPHTSPSIPPKVLWPVLIVVILGIAVGGFFLLNSYIYNEKQGDDTNQKDSTEQNTVEQNYNSNMSISEETDGKYISYIYDLSFDIPSGWQVDESTTRTDDIILVTNGDSKITLSRRPNKYDSGVGGTPGFEAYREYVPDVQYDIPSYIDPPISEGFTKVIKYGWQTEITGQHNDQIFTLYFLSPGGTGNYFYVLEADPALEDSYNAIKKSLRFFVFNPTGSEQYSCAVQGKSDWVEYTNLPLGISVCLPSDWEAYIVNSNWDYQEVGIRPKDQSTGHPLTIKTANSFYMDRWRGYWSPSSSEKIYNISQIVPAEQITINNARGWKLQLPLLNSTESVYWYTFPFFYRNIQASINTGEPEYEKALEILNTMWISKDVYGYQNEIEGEEEAAQYSAPVFNHYSTTRQFLSIRTLAGTSSCGPNGSPFCQLVGIEYGQKQLITDLLKVGSISSAISAGKLELLGVNPDSSSSIGSIMMNIDDKTYSFNVDTGALEPYSNYYY